MYVDTSCILSSTRSYMLQQYDRFDRLKEKEFYKRRNGIIFTDSALKLYFDKKKERKEISCYVQVTETQGTFELSSRFSGGQMCRTQLK